MLISHKIPHKSRKNDLCYNKYMEDQLETIKQWLGTGSINLFGLPMSGKDTVGVRLAEDLGGRFLSSGLIIRAIEADEHLTLTAKGNLWPTDMFRERIIPYISREDLKDYPLILSSVGRWSGEEQPVIDACAKSGHHLKAAVVLNVSEADVISRWEAAKASGDRGDRPDDRKIEVFKTRLDEFRNKTLPVLNHYRDLGLLIPVDADTDRDTVYRNVVAALYDRATH